MTVNSNPGKSPNLNLQLALANLETFAQQIERDSQLEVHEGKLVVLPPCSFRKKISQAFQRFITPKKPTHQAKIISTIQANSDTIKSYLPLIQTMSNGTPEQKKFAEYAKTAIERFNRSLDENESKGLHVGSRLIKIEIPKKAYIQFDGPKFLNEIPSTKKIFSALQFIPKSTESIEKISHVSQTLLPTFQLERKTFELYLMKMIVLLEQELLHPIEARKLILRTPIDFSIDSKTESATISQNLCPTLGQPIAISAQFRMDQRLRSFSIFQTAQIRRD